MDTRQAGDVTTRRMRGNDSFDSMHTLGGRFRLTGNRGSSASLVENAGGYTLGLPQIASFGALLGMDAVVCGPQRTGVPGERGTPVPCRSPTACDLPQYNFSFSDLMKMNASPDASNAVASSDWFATDTIGCGQIPGGEGLQNEPALLAMNMGMNESNDVSVYSEPRDANEALLEFEPAKPVTMKDFALETIAPFEASNENSELARSHQQRDRSWGDESSHPTKREPRDARMVTATTPKVKKSVAAFSPISEDPTLPAAKVSGGPNSLAAVKKPRKRHQKALNRLREQILMLQSRSMVATQLSKVHASEHAFLVAENARLVEENRAFKAYLDARVAADQELASTLNELEPVPCGMPHCKHDKLPVKPYRTSG